MGSFYDSDEVEKLFEAAKGTVLEIPVFLGAFYGLRRSEVLGLKWSAIDFQNNTITIKHTVTSCNLDGKHIQVAQDTTKTKSSLRILPPVYNKASDKVVFPASTWAKRPAVIYFIGLSSDDSSIKNAPFCCLW